MVCISMMATGAGILLPKIVLFGRHIGFYLKFLMVTAKSLSGITSITPLVMRDRYLLISLGWLCKDTISAD